MKRTTTDIESLDETGAEMERLTKTYWQDIVPYAKHMDLVFWHQYVCNLEYLPDPEEEELVSRPAISLSEDAQYRDCDDKCILLGSYLYWKRIPFKYGACSYKKSDEQHHAIILTPQYGIIDCTFAGTAFPRSRDFYNVIPISRWLR